MASKIALVDGDSLVYRGGFAAEKTHYMIEDGTGHNVVFCENYKDAIAKGKDRPSVLWSRKEIEPVGNCLQIVKTSLENTLNVLGVQEYRVYLSGRRNFREDVWPDYKGNRDAAPRPKYYRDIRNYLVAQWGAVVVDGYEADDAIGIAASGGHGSRSVIVAVDKDLDQIPGDHYNWVDGESYTVSQRDGLRFFYEQMLSGDATDNIEGISGIGPKKAQKALSDCRTPHDCAVVVLQHYQEAMASGDNQGSEATGPVKQIIERNARLLWIWRKENDEHPFWRHLNG